MPQLYILLFNMKIGANDINAVKIGTTDVNKVYLGSNLVWQKTGLLLDLYPNAIAAYSLRKLRTAYAGAAIEVRIDTTGQPVYNIGFDSNGDLDTADLLAKAGANDAYVSKWYDQSGNGNNAVNGSASTQPVIVTSGVVETLNGSPAVFADNKALTAGSVSADDGVGQTSSFGLFNVTSDGIVISLDNSPRIARPFQVVSGNLRLLSFSPSVTTAIDNVPYTNGTNVIGSSIRKTGSLEVFNNGFSNGSTASGLLATGATDLDFFHRTVGVDSITGRLAEYILYPSDQSANRINIEKNINGNYQIYWDGSQTGLLDSYPNASAAYSLRALNSAYTGPLVKVRRSDNAELNIYAKYDGSLDTDALLNFVGAGDGFVTTWYDQSGNGLDTTNSTASNQPQIVSSGSIITEGGLPTIDFNGDYLINAGNFNYNGGLSIFSVFNSSVIAGGARIVSDDITGVQGNFIFYSDSTISLNDNGSGYKNISYSATNGNQLRTLVFNDSTGGYNILQNGSSLTSGNLSGWTGPIAPSGASNIGVMASGNGTQTLVGTMQELIVWGNNQSANRVGIETNINSKYSIYP